jgi:hypothetical protein
MGVTGHDSDDNARSPMMIRPDPRQLPGLDGYEGAPASQLGGLC